MKLVTNRSPNNHVETINRLALRSRTIVLCSGWLNNKGIKKIEKSLSQALQNDASITIYSNKKHTGKTVSRTIAKHKGIKHVIIEKPYLHSKAYYFEQEAIFTALVGSANLTNGGLGENEELSVEISGNLGSSQHKAIFSYLEGIKQLANKGLNSDAAKVAARG